MKATVDPDLCTACEECYNAVPEVFEAGEGGIAVVKGDEVPADKEDGVSQAADDCPAAAIELD